VIVCGWCHSETVPGRCSACGRDPATPWVQRGEAPPSVEDWRLLMKYTRLSQAKRELGPNATVEQIAEHLSVSPRTVRRWQSPDLVRPSEPDED
jgi:hypothetical protein